VAAGDVSFQRERVADLWAELLPLFVQHHAASDGPLRNERLNVDTDTYELVDEAGGLRCFTARDAEGTLIGYAGFFVREHLHHKHLKIASHDVLFVAPSHREGATGLRLMAYANGELAREDVSLVTHVAHVGSPFGAMLERLRYVPSHNGYLKRI
jgi:hypothetical protein